MRVLHSTAHKVFTRGPSAQCSPICCFWHIPLYHEIINPVQGALLHVYRPPKNIHHPPALYSDISMGVCLDITCVIRCIFWVENAFSRSAITFDWVNIFQCFFFWHYKDILENVQVNHRGNFHPYIGPYLMKHPILGPKKHATL